VTLRAGPLPIKGRDEDMIENSICWALKGARNILRYSEKRPRGQLRHLTYSEQINMPGAEPT